MTYRAWGPPPTPCADEALRGARVVLRPVTPRDYPLIRDWQNDPDVAWLMDYEGAFTLDDIAAQEAEASRDGCPFVIEVDGRPVGRIGLNRFRTRDRACALYVYVGLPSLWGRGIGRDAVRTILGHAFDTLGLDLVELWTLAGNDRAVRSYEASGFRIDGRLRSRSLKGDARHDHVVMSITREEHAARQEQDTGSRRQEEATAH